MDNGYRYRGILNSNAVGVHGSRLTVLSYLGVIVMYQLLECPPSSYI